MVNDAWLGPLVRNLDSPATEASANVALQAVLQRAGDEATSIADALVPYVKDMKTGRGRLHGISILRPYASSSEQVTEFLVQLTHEEDIGLRRSATAALVGMSHGVGVRARMLELVSDPDDDVKNTVMQAIAERDITAEPSQAELVLYVIPDDATREEAAHALEELERAVYVLQDLGLDDGQNQIVEELILPNIKELKQVLAVQFEDRALVKEKRKHGLITLSGLRSSAHALALATATAANAGPAAEAVKNGAELLVPVIKTVAELVL